MKGFTPDSPRTVPDIVTDCTNWIPYEAGMESAPSESDAGIDALAAACIGAAAVTKLDSTNRIFAGTSTRLYELSGTSWTDRSAGGLAYASTLNWQFTQFGDTTIAAGYGNALQASSSGAFAAISGAPQAKVLFSVITSGGGFVIAANTNTSGDQWACSGVNDHTTWTASISTQANSGRLLGNDSGVITAGIELGDSPILLKKRTMFVGTYVGGSATFKWSEVPGGAGAVGPDAVCSIDAGIFFVGPDQIWIFDGARPIPVGIGQVRQWFFENSSPNHRSKTICVYDRFKNRVRIFYPSRSSTGTIDSQLVYHLATKEWGINDIVVEYAFLSSLPSVTMDTVTGTMDNAPETMDSDYWNPSEQIVTTFNSSHKYTTLSGAPDGSGYTTGDFGNEFIDTFFSGYRLTYQTQPQAATVSSYVLDEASEDGTLVGSVSYDSRDGTLNKFDVRQRGRFHRLSFSFTGTCRIIDGKAQLTPAGGR